MFALVQRSLVDVAPYVYLGCYKDNGDSDSEGPIEYRDIKVLVNGSVGKLKVFDGFKYLHDQTPLLL